MLHARTCGCLYLVINDITLPTPIVVRVFDCMATGSAHDPAYAWTLVEELPVSDPIRASSAVRALSHAEIVEWVGQTQRQIEEGHQATSALINLSSAINALTSE